jgi:uncharacterized membrane protein
MGYNILSMLIFAVVCVLTFVFNFITWKEFIVIFVFIFGNNIMLYSQNKKEFVSNNDLNKAIEIFNKEIKK